MSGLAVLSRARGQRARSCLPVIEAAVSKAEGARYRRGMEKLRRSLEAKHRPILEAHLRDLGKHVASVAAAQGGLLVEPPDAPTEAATTAAMDAASQKEQARINAILKAAKLPAWRQDTLIEWIEDLYDGAWLGELSLAQQELETTARDKAIKAVLKEGGTRLGLIDIPGDTRSALFRVLEFSREWEVGQPSPMQVAKWIQSEVPAGRFVNAGPRYRAQLIARTEVMHATRKGAIERARVDPAIKLLTAFDGDQDEACALRNGSDFTPAEADIENSATHPNCTLMFVPAYVN